MKLTTRTVRRASAVAGAICAAILIPATALAAPARPAHPAATATRCTTAMLRAWLGIPGDGSAGHVTYQLELSNISSRTCTLNGFPGVSATGSGGRQLGSAAGRDSAHPATTIVLAPRGTAHALLSIANVGDFPAAQCKPVTASGLKVFPPSDFTATGFPFSFRACSKRGPVYLEVTRMISGTGIPGFSS